MNQQRITLVCLLGILLATLIPASGQSLDRMVWGIAGGIGMNTSGQLSHTMGQIWTHTTRESGKALLTQGFQQPELTGPPTGLAAPFLLKGNIFPNPVQAGQHIQVSFQFSERSSVELRVIDVHGRACALLWEKSELASLSLVERLQMPASLAAGMYWLRLETPSSHVSFPLQVE